MPQPLKNPSVPPAFVVQLFMKLGNFLQRLRHNLMPAPVALINISTQVLTARALYLFARFGIADLLAAGPRSVEELARAAQANADALRRVLRNVAALGVVQSDGPDRYRLARLGQSLRSDVPGSMRDWVVMTGTGWGWRAFGEAEPAFRSGETAFVLGNGAPFFDYLAKNTEDAMIFDRAMTCFSGMAAPVVAKGYDFSGIKTLMDVAGGHGQLMAAVLTEYPGLKGIILDQPYVVQGTQKRMEEFGLAGRCACVAGDIFKEIPRGADAYILRSIIHDWADEQALSILKNCRQAVPAHGRLLLVELVVPEGDQPHPSKELDMAMLWLTGGRERTTEGYRELLGRAGFRLQRVVPTASPESVVEAVPA